MYCTISCIYKHDNFLDQSECCLFYTKGSGDMKVSFPAADLVCEGSLSRHADISPYINPTRRILAQCTNSAVLARIPMCVYQNQHAINILLLLCGRVPFMISKCCQHSRLFSLLFFFMFNCQMIFKVCNRHLGPARFSPLSKKTDFLIHYPRLCFNAILNFESMVLSSYFQFLQHLAAHDVGLTLSVLL